MASIEGLVRAYRDFVRLPWDPRLSGAQRVWFAVYDPPQERRLRLRVEEFAEATRAAGHGWFLLDITDDFAHWMAGHDYREEYFAQPEDMEMALSEFADHEAERVRAALTAPEVDDGTVVAILGAGALLGLMHVSDLMRRVARDIRGRLLVFFPGQFDNSVYRLLDARDGYDYHAVPILAEGR